MWRKAQQENKSIKLLLCLQKKSDLKLSHLPSGEARDTTDS